MNRSYRPTKQRESQKTRNRAQQLSDARSRIGLEKSTPTEASDSSQRTSQTSRSKPGPSSRPSGDADTTEEPPTKTRKLTASERKLGYFRLDVPGAEENKNSDSDQDSVSDLESVVSDSGVGDDLDPLGYKFVRNDVWDKMLVNLKCPFCKKQGMSYKSKSDKGFSSKIQLVCSFCDRIISQSYTSPQLSRHKGTPFEINKKMVETFLVNGSGHSGMERLSINVNMKCMSRKTYSKFVKMIAEESSEFIDDVLLLARQIVKAAHKELDPDLDGQEIIEVTVSFDGSWHKRGFSSPYGVGLVIDVLTGLVIDYVVLCKECAVCNQKESQLSKEAFATWQETHRNNNQCDRNYWGSSKSMETAVAEVLWKRSEEKGFQYTGLLSDGDANTHAHLQSLELYGGKEILKEECNNHVGKRLVEGMKTIVAKCKAQKITLGGQKAGSLTEVKMRTMQSYYREAIRKNVPNIQLMKCAIMASPYHCMSTDKKPQHQYCPGGEKSWCFYNKALALGKKPAPHASSISTPLRPDVVKHILPVYKRLSTDELLKRCVNLGTQNPNESIHSAIWSKCPKSKNTSLKKVEVIYCLFLKFYANI